MNMNIGAVQNGAAQPNREQISIRIPSESRPDQSGVIVDPSIAKKLEVSKSSIKDELNLMKTEEQRREKNQEMLNDVREQLLKLELMLQTAVASLAFDATSLEHARDRIASQLQDHGGIIKFAQLPELDHAITELNSDNANLNNSEHAEKLRLTLNAAVAEVERAISQAGADGPQKKTVKTLQVAHQNAAAVLSTSNPQAVFSSSDKAAEILRENNLSTQLHAKLTPGVVIDLLS